MHACIYIEYICQSDSEDVIKCRLVAIRQGYQILDRFTIFNFFVYEEI